MAGPLVAKFGLYLDEGVLVGRGRGGRYASEVAVEWIF